MTQQQISRNKFSFVKENDARGTDHWHQDVELVYILSGQVQIKIDHTEKICTAGDIAVMHSGQIHSVRNYEAGVMYICMFEADIIRNLGSETRYSRNFISAEELDQNGLGDRLYEIFDEIYQENSVKGLWNDVVIHADLMRLYTLLVRNFERSDDEKPQNVAKIQLFQEALFYIEENYAQNLTLADVARSINYNPNYVSSLFVAYTGQNFKKYLDSFRTNKALELIKRTDCTFAEISAQCGFPNIRTFNNVFRKITGMTPSQLRQMSR